MGLNKSKIGTDDEGYESVRSHHPYNFGNRLHRLHKKRPSLIVPHHSHFVWHATLSTSATRCNIQSRKGLSSAKHMLPPFIFPRQMLAHGDQSRGLRIARSLFTRAFVHKISRRNTKLIECDSIKILL